jgi:hypothetical protein
LLLLLLLPQAVRCAASMKSLIMDLSWSMAAGDNEQCLLLQHSHTNDGNLCLCCFMLLLL